LCRRGLGDGTIRAKPPDVVITDVIMPDQDGYFRVQPNQADPEFCQTPVVLMSGVVNKSVADKAVSVKSG